MKYLLCAAIAVFMSYVIYYAFRINHLRTVARELVVTTQPYQQSPDAPTKRILIVGDSLQAGVGASTSADSMAGLLGDDFPQYEIVNLAESGDETGDALEKISQLDRDDFDVAIVQIGANDIFHRVDLEQSVKNLTQVLEVAKQKSDRAIFMTSGSVGYAPLFPAPLDWYFTHRSRQAIPEFIAVASGLDVEVVDNYRARDNDPFEQQPEKYYAPDKFHLSNAGYQLWYERLKVVIEN